jgi:phthalate 4,5-cis-dihydrodiol dehydrogenase
MTLGIGVVGLGIAGTVMVPAIHSHPGVHLAAAAEPQRVLRSRFASGEDVPAVATVEELVETAGVDVVYIASPHQFHADQAVLAAAAGKHVVVEKPMALSLDDCDRMIAAARQHGVTLVVGHSHGFDPAVRVIADLVRSGAYGELGLIAMWNYTDFIYRPRRAEELDPAAGGGILFNQLPHQVDVVRTIATAPVVGVTARTSLLDPARRVPGTCAATLDFADDAVAQLVYSGYDHFDSDELHGWVAEGGGAKQPAHGAARARLRGLGENGERAARSGWFGYGFRRPERPVHQPHFGELVVSCAGADLRPGPDSVIAYTDEGCREYPLPRSPWWPGRGEVLEELVRAVRDGEPAVHDGAFGRETLRVCLALDRSAARRTTEHLEPAVRQTEGAR